MLATTVLANSALANTLLADGFADTINDGSLLLAVPIAFLVGLISFLSPCTLPLVPGYLSYVTGLSGADLADDVDGGRPGHRRSRVLMGSVLFVLGFTAVFVSLGALFGTLGATVQTHILIIERVLGVVTILLGVAFLGYIPLLQREWRIHRLPQAGLMGAPLLGVAFGVGWAPCQGPTLGAIQTLAFSSGRAGEGALLTAFYCAGLGLPFVITALAYRRAMGAFTVVKRHYRAVTVFGGVTMIVIGVLLVTGAWNDITIWMQVHMTNRFTTVI
ncbi:MAG: cytochrome c-type biosis protein [Frankiales bacterium]|jgi:cytochrome c-type biogenesis protein|nr:cytochrome c-type biosis protein [Frankiales bacterium]